MTQTQVNTKLVSARDVAFRRHFLMGYDDASRSAPYNKKYDEWDKIDDQWDYERGRLTASEVKRRGIRVPVLYPGTRKIHPEIVLLFERLVANGDVR